VLTDELKKEEEEERLFFVNLIEMSLLVGEPGIVELVL
jgi:hypothetical protein